MAPPLCPAGAATLASPRVLLGLVYRPLRVTRRGDTSMVRLHKIPRLPTTPLLLPTTLPPLAPHCTLRAPHCTPPCSLTHPPAHCHTPSVCNPTQWCSTVVMCTTVPAIGVMYLASLQNGRHDACLSSILTLSSTPKYSVFLPLTPTCSGRTVS